MIGTLFMTGIEFAGSIGIGTMVGSAATTLIPEGAGVATKVCVSVGAGLTGLAAERIVVREFEAYCDELKTMVNDIKDVNRARKLDRELTKLKKELKEYPDDTKELDGEIKRLMEETKKNPDKAEDLVREFEDGVIKKLRKNIK